MRSFVSSLSKTVVMPVASFAVLASSLGVTTATAQPQTGIPIGSPIMQPGLYQMVDVAKIESNRIDWSKSLQRQDQEQYLAATRDSKAAYESLYNKGLMPLRAITNDTFLAKKRIATPGELATAIDEFIRQRDLFDQQLAALSVVSDVWSGLATQPTNSSVQNVQVETVYKRGSLNLKALANEYRLAIERMTTEASKYQYTVSNGSRGLETAPGGGLVKVGSVDTPEFIRAKLNDFTTKAALTQADIEALSQMAIDWKTQAFEFTEANDIKLFWYNKMQKGDAESWVESLQHKARVMQYARGLYCMQVGAPALAIPAPKRGNVDYLVRDVKSRIRLVEAAEFDGKNIKATLTRMDLWLESLKSQAGEKDETEGVMGYIHRANSTFTWHNEVAAYLSILKILRDMYVDERDLSDSPWLNCAKVRARYNARYGSFKEQSFMNEFEMWMTMGAASPDPGRRAFSIAGGVILTKGSFAKQHFDYLRNNPSASVLGKSILDDPGLK